MRSLKLVSMIVLCLASLVAAAPARGQVAFPATAADFARSSEPTAVPVSTSEAALSEYGVASTGSARYSRGPESFDVTVFKMKDASGAYGFYSFLQQPEMRRANFTDHSAISSKGALILVGNLVLEVENPNAAALSRPIDALVKSFSAQAEVGSLPILGSYLPAERRVDFSDRYVLGPQTLDQLFPGGIGNSVGFNRSAEAEVAHYKLGAHDATLLLVGLPTDQLAAAQLSELQKNFNVNGAGSSSGAPLYAKRSARLLAIVAGATSQAEANALLDQIQMETERSWSEPVPKHEPPIEMMIEGSIVGALTICIFALVAGLSFGGVRLVVKRVAPGKIFDRSADLQVLQLGLGSKPINSDDFYGYTGGTSGPPAEVDKNLPDRVALRIFR
jgi:hypothetical protein